MERRAVIARRWIVLMLGVVLALGAAAGPGTATPAFKGDIPLGVLYTKDGVWGSYGVRAFRAIDIAVQDVNAAGGINGYRLAPKIYDNHGELAEVASLVRKMALEDRVVAMVGPNSSGEAEVAFPVAAATGVPVLATSTAKGGIMKLGFRDGKQWAFRNVAPDDQNTAPVIEQVVKDRHITTVAIVYDTKDAVSKYMGGIFWTGLMKKLNVTVVDVATFASGDPSVAAQVTKIKADKPDAVILAAAPGEAAKVAIEIQRQEMKTQLLGSGALYGDEFLKAGGSAVDHTITAAQYWRENPNPAVQAILKRYEARTGAPAALHEAYAYDAIMLLTDIMKRAGVTNDSSKLQAYRDAVRADLVNAKWTGMSGTFTLVPTGDVIRPFLRATIDRGRWDIQVLKVQ